MPRLNWDDYTELVLFVNGQQTEKSLVAIKKIREVTTPEVGLHVAFDRLAESFNAPNYMHIWPPDASGQSLCLAAVSSARIRKVGGVNTLIGSLGVVRHSLPLDAEVIARSMAVAAGVPSA